MKKIFAALLGLALVGASCGDDGDTAAATPAIVIEGGAAGSADSATPAASGTDEELALAFAQCMRDNGVPDFEDPVVDADGSIDLLGRGGPGGPGGIDPGDPTVQNAFDECGDLLAGASFLPGAGQTTSELEDTFLAFAECLRDLGYDVDDPDLSGGLGPQTGDGGPAAIFGDSFDITDPANADAVQQCQAVFGADGPFGGGVN